MVYGERSPATISLKQQSTQLVYLVYTYVCMYISLMLYCRLQKEVRSSSRRKIDSRISKMYSLDKSTYVRTSIGLVNYYASSKFNISSILVHCRIHLLAIIYVCYIFVDPLMEQEIPRSASPFEVD